MDPEALVVARWARVFGLDDRALRRPGVRLVVDAPGLVGYRGAFLLQLGSACIVAVPADHRGAAEAAIRDRTPAEVFSVDTAHAIDERGTVLGPSWHGWCARDALRLPTDGRARRLDPMADGDGLRRLRRFTGDADWIEGGFEPLPEWLWGIDDERGLAAVANLTDVDGAPADVGLVTRPDARHQGYATAVAATICHAAPEATPLLRYRALFTNEASLRVARRLGFQGIGSNIAVRFP